MRQDGTPKGSISPPTLAHHEQITNVKE